MLPALTAILAAGKFLAPLAVKKLAVTKILQKVGPEKAVDSLRGVNAKLRQSVPAYGHSAADRAEEGLTALEEGIKGVRGHEAVAKAWVWFERLEKDNPTLANAVIKTYLEGMTPLQWARVVLSGVTTTESAAPAEGASAGGSGANSAARGNGASRSGAELLDLLHEGHPELKDYHVILIPKDAEAHAALGAAPPPSDAAAGTGSRPDGKV